MRIESMRVNNFIGVRSLETTFRAPVVLFAGRNAAGKSSLQAAIRMALLGVPERVVLKKDYDKLVTEGATGGEISIKVHVGEGLDAESTVVHVALPDGTPTPFTKRPRFLEYCLQAERFSHITEDERRQVLFALTKLNLSAEGIVKRLIGEKRCDEYLVGEVAPALKGGFAAGHKDACDRARDAKSAWRGATGETWGKDKGATWGPAGVAAFGDIDREVLQRVQRDISTATSAEREAQDHLAGLEARAKAATPNLGGDPEKAARVPHITAAITDATVECGQREQELARLQAVLETPTGLACPHCGGLVVQDGFELKAFEGHDSAARASAKKELPAAKSALDAARAHLAKLRREEGEARDHAAKVAAAKAVKEKAPTPHEIDEAREKVALATDELRSLREEETRLLEVQRAASAASSAAARAQVLHMQAIGYLGIAEALSPSGIPGEMLATALKPFNDKLREAAVMTGWRQVAIGGDMAITAEGRPYALLSESERWRTDAMLAYAIAAHGPGFLMLDRMDVLDIPGRGQALMWLTELVRQHRLEGAIVCATLKAAPGALPEGVEGYWLEGGQILDLKAAA